MAFPLTQQFPQQVAPVLYGGSHSRSSYDVGPYYYLRDIKDCGGWSFVKANWESLATINLIIENTQNRIFQLNAWQAQLYNQIMNFEHYFLDISSSPYDYQMRKTYDPQYSNLISTFFQNKAELSNLEISLNNLRWQLGVLLQEYQNLRSGFFR
ncbi:hypothetical protein NHP200010_04640 [Helicobacter bizzozeronii]|nr:hypothetical protein NHP200010_04640 [Helicobacter bizzozeronii]